MDAKTRYRQRLKVQAAMCRVLALLLDNGLKKISPDRTTALMAWQVVRKLMPFIQAAGLTPEELPDTSDGSNLARFAHLLHDRKKETDKRKARRRRQARNTASDKT
jgi:hypothetical protein